QVDSLLIRSRSVAYGQGSKAFLSAPQQYSLDFRLNLTVSSVVERGFNPRNDIRLESTYFNAWRTQYKGDPILRIRLWPKSAKF
ncbi:hypothetical protein, partial [Moorena sp. SIO4E2]|uniref:hypothetical protein n=1 Tax=Moorena sp. SIO4E2 TaxID=2607826 RepID=UPI00338DEF9C